MHREDTDELLGRRCLRCIVRKLVSLVFSQGLSNEQKSFLVDKNESPIRSIPNEFRKFEWTCLLYSDIARSVETHLTKVLGDRNQRAANGLVFLDLKFKYVDDWLRGPPRGHRSSRR
jgi:hypothetical protein